MVGAQSSYRLFNYTLYPDGDEIMNISSSLGSAIAELGSPTAARTPAPGSATTSNSGTPLQSAGSASGSIMKVASEVVEADTGLLGVA